MTALSALESLARARELRLSGQAQEAEALLRSALSGDPDDIGCIDELSLLIHPVAALDLYRRYFDRQTGSYPIGAYPALVPKVGEYAVTFYRIARKDLAGSIVDILLAFRQHIADPALLVEIGTAARLAADFDRAVALFNEAETYPSLKWEALKNLAFLHQNAGSLVEAERCQLALLPVVSGPAKYGYCFELTLNYMTQSKYERALSVIEEAEASGLDSEQKAEILCYKFLCQLELGRIPLATRTAEAHAAIKANGDFVSREHAEDAALNAKFGSLFADGAIKHLVSLGGNCDFTTAARARGVKTQSPFDWIITPHDALIDIFVEGGKRLMTSVSVDTIRLLRTAVCNEHGVLYVHEFPRSADGQPIIDETLMGAAKRMLTYKMEVLENYCRAGEPILFVRKALPVGAWLTDRRLVSDDLNKIVSTIDAKFPTANFHLAFFYHRGFCDAFDFSGPLDPRIIIVDEADGLDVSDMLGYYNLRSGHRVNVRANRVDHLPDLFVGAGVAEMDVAVLMDELKEPIERGMHHVLMYFLRRWLELHLKNDPSAYLAYYNLGLAYRNQGNEKAASEAMRSCLDLAPDFEAARSVFGR